MDGKTQITLQPGDHVVNIKSRKEADIFRRILKKFNYQTVDEIIEFFDGDGEVPTREYTEKECDEGVQEGLMSCYNLNGEKYYVLRTDAKDRIKEIVKEYDPEGDPSGEDYEVKQ